MKSLYQGVRVYYQGKHRGMGTYKTKEEAVLANQVARNCIAATKDSVLSIEESAEIAKLAKEAARKAVSEMMGVSEAAVQRRLTKASPIGVTQKPSGSWVSQ